MILALSLRPIPFHQDNYSFQFDPDNSRSFTLFLLSFVLYFSLISLQLINHSKFITQSRFRGCEVSSEEVIKTTTITEWTKTYEAMIPISDLFLRTSLKENKLLYEIPGGGGTEKI